MQIITNLVLDVIRRMPARQYLVIPHGDNGTRVLRIRLTNMGEPVEIPEDVVPVLCVRKPDGTSTMTDGRMENGAFLFELKAQTLACIGDAICDMQVISGLDVLTSASFELRVVPSVIGNEEIASSSEYNIFAMAMLEAREALSEADAATASAEAAVAKMEEQESRLENKIDKDTIVTEAAENTLVLEENQDARLGEMEDLVLSLPESIGDRYKSTFSFQSGEKATSLRYGYLPLEWNGDDVTPGRRFVPEPYSVYEVNAKNLGVNGIRARVDKVAGYTSVDVEGTVLSLPDSAGKALRNYKIYGNSIQTAKNVSGETVAYDAVEDTYVQAKYPTVNYGGVNVLQAKYCENDKSTVYRAAYIKFAVPDNISDKAVKLMLWARISESNAMSSASQTCYLATSDSDWESSTMTYATRTAVQDAIAEFAVSGTEYQKYLVDVTSAVRKAAERGDAEITFVFLGGKNYITDIYSMKGTAKKWHSSLVVGDIPYAVENVGDYNEETGMYDIPVTVHGGNLIPFENSYVVKKLGLRLDTEEVVNALNTLKPGTYTMSYTATLTEIDEETYLSGDYGGILLRFGTCDIWVTTGSWDNCSVGTTRQRSKTFTLTEEDIASGIQAVYGYGCMHFGSTSLGYPAEVTGTAEIYNIQFEAGGVATEYVPYVEPKTTVISLEKPLRKVEDVADYIDFKNNCVVRQVEVLDDTGARPIEESYAVMDEPIFLPYESQMPEIKTNLYDNILTVDTETQPSNVKVTYFKKG